LHGRFTGDGRKRVGEHVAAAPNDRIVAGAERGAPRRPRAPWAALECSASERPRAGGHSKNAAIYLGQTDPRRSYRPAAG
jgi:hypothetical protein